MEWGKIKENLYYDKIWKNKGRNWAGTDCGRNNEKPEMDWEEVSENLNWDGWIEIKDKLNWDKIWKIKKKLNSDELGEITEKLNWDKIWKGKGESELGWIGEK